MKKMLVSMAIASLLGIGYDAGRIKSINDRRTEEFNDKLTLQEPPMGFLDAWKYEWGRQLDMMGIKNDMSSRKRNALIEKLDRTNEDARVDEIAGALSYYDPSINKAAARALGRIGTQNARNALYKTLVETGTTENELETAYYAAEQLMTINPRLVAQTVIAMKNSKLQYFETPNTKRLLDLAKKGNPEAALMDMIRRIKSRSMGLEPLADLLIENRGKPFIRRREYEILEIIDSTIVQHHHTGEYLYCGGGYEHLYKIIKGAYSVDPDFAKKRYLPMMGNTPCDRGSGWITRDLQNDGFFR